MLLIPGPVRHERIKEDVFLKATLIDVENMDYFLPAVEKEALLKSDIFLGAVEESSDTAAGVLAATATPDKMLSINYI